MRRKKSYLHIIFPLFALAILVGYFIVINNPDKELAFSLTETKEENNGKNSMAEIRELIDGMTLEEKVGQLFIGRCPVNNKYEKDGETYQLGFFMLLADFFMDKDFEKAKEIIDKIRSSSKVPIAFVAEEEGGDNVVISRYEAYRESPFPSPRTYGELKNIEEKDAILKEKAETLNAIGVNMLWGPSCDLADSINAFMYQRSMGLSPQETGSEVQRGIGIFKGKNVSLVLKYFPGHGNNGDSIIKTIYDLRDYSEFVNRDFVPFQMGIEGGAEFILLSHNIVVSKDENYPVSLSPIWHRILRENLGFNGIIIADNLKAKALNSKYNPEEAAILAFEAGNDLVYTSIYDVQIPAVVKAVRDGRLSESSLDLSLSKVLKWKKDRGLI